MQLISTHTILTSDLGVKGNLFGGVFVTWIDLAAYNLAAEAIKDPNIVTLKISECLFLQPAKINNIVKIYGRIARVGNTSVTVEIEARKIDVIKGDEVVLCTTSVVMVLVDVYGNPKKIKKAAIKDSF